MSVKVYTTPTCGYCHQVKDYLRERGVPYQEYDVSRDRNAAQEMVNLTGQMGVPVIVVDDEVVIGFDRARLAQLLAQRPAGKGVKFGLRIADGQSGALVGAVAPDGLGARLGLTAGDIVTDINTRPVRNAADMERVIGALAPGNIVTMKFRRRGEPRKSEIIA